MDIYYFYCCFENYNIWFLIKDWNKEQTGRRGGSLSNAFASQAWGPRWEPQIGCKIAGDVHLKSSAWKMDTKGYQGLLVSIAYCWVLDQWGTLPQKMYLVILRITSKVIYLSSCLISTCIHVQIHPTYVNLHLHKYKQPAYKLLFKVKDITFNSRNKRRRIRGAEGIKNGKETLQKDFHKFDNWYKKKFLLM